ncbi:MAG: iron-dependent repressor [Pedobacter sp.]|jgi:DtxR family Mn-dependent transcriptional regulator|nr:iron-dependent repressor [Pedobacter sp.]
MSTTSYSEENYLKVIYHLSQKSSGAVQTNTIAENIGTKPASVTDMLKKLADKRLIDYVKYQGVSLTEKGQLTAIGIVRKHRLWEVFLVDKLKLKWDEVHEIAEELEHINSDLLVERLDEYLGRPKTDPHGDSIPDKDGKFHAVNLTKLNELSAGNTGMIVGVSEHSSAYLKHLEKLGLTLGKEIQVVEVVEFDGSVELILEDKKVNISRDVAKHILVNEEF